MAAFLYPLYALLYVGLLGYAGWIYRRTHTWSAFFVLCILVGLFYDNLILSIGGMMGTGSLLETLSWPRFILHQLVLPLLIPAIVAQARRAGIGWTNHPQAARITIVATLITIVLGIFTRLVGQQLEPEIVDGVLRYSATNTSGPPLVSILSIGFAGFTGWFLWRKAGWPWVFWIALAVLVGESLPARNLRLFLGSGIEVVFMWVILQTELWSTRLRRVEL
jgi:hypothetical protein